MAGDSDREQDEDVLDLTEADELDEGAGDDEADDDESGGDDGEDDDEAEGSDEDGDDEGVLIGFDDELEGDDDADKPGDSKTIKEMRAQLRASTARIRALESTTKKPAAVDLREKPTLEGHAFDEEAYEADLLAWHNEKRSIEAEGEKQREADQRIQQDWQRDVQTYEAKKAALRVSDFADAEGEVTSRLSMVQQAVIVKAATDPAAMIYALGRSPARLAELAKIEDPVKMAAAVARMEGAVKVVQRKKSPELDRPERGSAKVISSDKKREELERQADKTGDRTKLIAYDKAQKAKASAKGK